MCFIILMFAAAPLLSDIIEMRSLYPQIWEELEGLDYNYIRECSPYYVNQTDCLEFSIEKNDENPYIGKATMEDT